MYNWRKHYGPSHNRRKRTAMKLRTAKKIAKAILTNHKLRYSDSQVERAINRIRPGHLFNMFMEKPKP